MPQCPNCKNLGSTPGLCRRCVDQIRGQSTASQPRCLNCGMTATAAVEDAICIGSDEGHGFATRFDPKVLPREERGQALQEVARKRRADEDRCLNCGQTRDVSDKYACSEAPHHIFMADLFRPATPPPPPPNLDETSMDDPPDGLGLKGERFDLTCADCGKTFLRLKKSVHGFFYGCPSWPECEGTHGAHPDGSPKGIPGNKMTRGARIEAHKFFDQLFSGPKRQMSEPEAYAWMAREMGLAPADAHIARFDIKQCLQLVRLVNVKLGPTGWDAILGDDDPFGASEVVAEQEGTRPPAPRPPSGDRYTITEFSDGCLDGSWTDDDGIGYFGTATAEFHEDPVSCAAFEEDNTYIPPGCTHVWWYNK